MVPPQDCEAPACCEGNCQPGCPAPSGDMDALLNKRLMKSSRSASLQHQTTNQPHSQMGTLHLTGMHGPPFCHHTHTHTHSVSFTHTHTHSFTHRLSLSHTNSFSHAQTLYFTHKLTCTNSLFHTQTLFLTHINPVSLTHTNKIPQYHKKRLKC